MVHVCRLNGGVASDMAPSRSCGQVIGRGDQAAALLEVWDDCHLVALEVICLSRYTGR
jgi:hypothetical protein